MSKEGERVTKEWVIINNQHTKVTLIVILLT